MKKLLPLIKGPEIIKSFNYSSLEKLAEEIREVIIETVQKNGGHLSSNLGTVELTIALHYVFNSPEDKIIWDVGHQSYAHKLLTGRYEKFHTLRKYQGLSGFPNPNESEHDLFIVGHSSTSIALASGLAQARDIKKEKNKIIAVIGDGALTSGLAYEAINNVGHRKNDLIIILNDNEMSISKNVGIISEYLSKIMATPIYNRLKSEIDNIIKKFRFHNKATEILHRLEESIKILLLPQVLFEDLGLKYFGVIDGHNIKDLINILKKIKELNYPIILHIKTIKGKGYKDAEEKPITFHGVSAPTNKNGSTAKTYTQIFGEEIIKIAETNEKIIAITAAMAEGCGLTEFEKKFPQRFFDVGIAEEYAVTFAAGLAKAGFLPVVTIYSTFLQRAYDQIIHDVALQNLPIIFTIDRAGLVGEDGPTHHGAFDFSYLSHIPNIIIMAPKDEIEFRKMLNFAVNSNKISAIRYPRRYAENFINSNSDLILGEPEIIINNEQNKILIIAIGSMVNEAYKAIIELNKENINCNFINLRFLKPLNFNSIKDIIHNSSLIFTIEENSVIGGMGAMINYLINQNFFDNKKSIINLGLPDSFIPAGDIDSLLKLVELDFLSLAKKIKFYYSKILL
ncbi:MAG TPA: 1-deoxy-D-xylulose-5-phosphate synthase [bacterium]|nr:1-deoxy-D-xylulose-5-phosphate synthase [bacterium]